LDKFPTRDQHQLILKSHILDTIKEESSTSESPYKMAEAVQPTSTAGIGAIVDKTAEEAKGLGTAGYGE
jgi:hypothetical protein